MATEQRRVIWRHPKGIYETVEVSGTGVFGVPYSYRETVYTQERDARGVARKEVQPAQPNGGRSAGGPRQLSSKLLKSISMAIEIQCDMAKDHRKRYREQEKIAESKNNLLAMGLYRGMAETERQYIETFNRWLKNI